MREEWKRSDEFAAQDYEECEKIQGHTQDIVTKQHVPCKFDEQTESCKCDVKSSGLPTLEQKKLEKTTSSFVAVERSI